MTAIEVDSGEPPTVRPTVSWLPPVPIARTSSWTPIALMALLGLAATFFVLKWTGQFDATMARVRAAASASEEADRDLARIPMPPEETEPVAASAQPEVSDEEAFWLRADDALRRWGKSNVLRGIMVLPPTFVSEDGNFDLVIHFHGNTDLVAEGMALSKLNAAVVIFNLGDGSSVYEKRFSDPFRFDDTLKHVKADLQERGLLAPKLRRVALTSWSAGYGAIQGLLSQPKVADRVDAILMFDGMHAAYLGEGPEIAPTSLAPFVAFAERATKGEKLFVLTHSDVEPIGYPGVAASADFLLGQLHVDRKPASGPTTFPGYASLEGIWPKGEMVSLEKESEAHAGNLHVFGFKGNQKGHHIAHLVQFPNTAMPLLTERWKKKAE